MPDPLCFAWDRNKAGTNWKKHRIRFEEASTVFADPLARLFDDETHSESERREIIVGTAITGRLLIVSFTELDEDVIRIISARAATPKERSDYEAKNETER